MIGALFSFLVLGLGSFLVCAIFVPRLRPYQKAVLIGVGSAFGVLLVGAALLFWPLIQDGFRSASQIRALQSRSDYPQIAAACVGLVHSVTNQSEIPVSDPRVPVLLRSLSPRYIIASTDEVTVEFHGGFDHYGYRVRQSSNDPQQWTMFYYTEQGEKPLATIGLPNLQGGADGRPPSSSETNRTSAAAASRRSP